MLATMKYIIILSVIIAFSYARPQQLGFQYLDEAIRQAQSENNFESDAVVIDVKLDLFELRSEKY